jgi:hypothetical protein
MAVLVYEDGRSRHPIRATAIIFAIAFRENAVVGLVVAVGSVLKRVSLADVR